MRGGDGGAQRIFEETCLHTLAQGVAYREFGHVILLLPEGDEIVVDAGLVLARVVEVEVLRLDVGWGEGLAGGELGDVGYEACFLRGGHAPDDDGAVVEEEDLGCVDACVEVDGVLLLWVVVGVWKGGRDGVGPRVETCVTGRCVKVEELFMTVMGRFLDFHSAVGVATFLRWVVDGSTVEDRGVDVLVERRFVCLRTVIVVGRIDTFVELLRVGASSACPAFQKLHDPF